jgi:hypothetical protein
MYLDAISQINLRYYRLYLFNLKKLDNINALSNKLFKSNFGF